MASEGDAGANERREDAGVERPAGAGADAAPALRAPRVVDRVDGPRREAPVEARAHNRAQRAGSANSRRLGRPRRAAGRRGLWPLVEVTRAELRDGLVVGRPPPRRGALCRLSSSASSLFNFCASAAAARAGCSPPSPSAARSAAAGAHVAAGYGGCADRGRVLDSAADVGPLASRAATGSPAPGLDSARRVRPGERDAAVHSATGPLYHSRNRRCRARAVSARKRTSASGSLARSRAT